MADQPSRKRRFVKRGIVALACILLLPGYIEGFRFFWWCEGYGATEHPYLRETLNLSLAPLHFYSEIPVLPGAVWLRSEMATQFKGGQAAARKEFADRHPAQTISD